MIIDARSSGCLEPEESVVPRSYLLLRSQVRGGHPIASEANLVHRHQASKYDLDQDQRALLVAPIRIRRLPHFRR